MQYGSLMESSARNCYFAMQKQQHAKTAWVSKKLVFMS